MVWSNYNSGFDIAKPTAAELVELVARDPNNNYLGIFLFIRHAARAS